MWDIDLGDAVMGVTRRRDGFRNGSDERSKAVVAICHSYLAEVEDETVRSGLDCSISPHRDEEVFRNRGEDVAIPHMGRRQQESSKLWL